MQTTQSAGGGPAPAPMPARRTILAPLPDEAPSPDGAAERQAPLDPAPRGAATPSRRAASGRAGSRGGRGHPQPAKPRAARDGKPESSTKAYLWRRNVRFLDRLVMDMEDGGARPGDINRSVVLRAAISALEDAGLARELARCTDEEELRHLIASRLARPGS